MPCFQPVSAEKRSGLAMFLSNRGLVVKRMKKLIASSFAATLLAVTAVAPSASAQPVITGGLVNVTITEVIDDVPSSFAT